MSAEEAGTLLSASDVIALLGLTPHPEGGHYAETFRGSERADGRADSSAIYFLLSEGVISRWHRIDAVEVWHWYAGAPLAMSIARDGEQAQTSHLGPSLQAGERPQLAVPKDAWQSAMSLGVWSLVGCTVAPAFEFDSFELAPEGWSPGET